MRIAASPLLIPLSLCYTTSLVWCSAENTVGSNFQHPPDNSPAVGLPDRCADPISQQSGASSQTLTNMSGTEIAAADAVNSEGVDHPAERGGVKAEPAGGTCQEPELKIPQRYIVGCNGDMAEASRRYVPYL